MSTDVDIIDDDYDDDEDEASDLDYMMQIQKNHHKEIKEQFKQLISTIKKSDKNGDLIAAIDKSDKTPALLAAVEKFESAVGRIIGSIPTPQVNVASPKVYVNNDEIAKSINEMSGSITDELQELKRVILTQNSGQITVEIVERNLNGTIKKAIISSDNKYTA